MSPQRKKQPIASMHEPSEPFKPDFRRDPLSDVERVLDGLEASWADFAYCLRTAHTITDDKGKRIGVAVDRYQRRAEGTRLRALSLDRVHALLEGARKKVAAGSRAAIFEAMLRCAEEGVPMPYWLADQLLDIGSRVRELKEGGEPANLHDLFGMQEVLPSGSGRNKVRAIGARREIAWRKKLWVEVHKVRREAMAATKMKKKGAAIRPLSKEAAIRRARERLKLPFEQRKARAMFDEQERIQREYLATK